MQDKFHHPHAVFKIGCLSIPASVGIVSQPRALCHKNMPYDLYMSHLSAQSALYKFLIMNLYAQAQLLNFRIEMIDDLCMSNIQLL